MNACSRAVKALSLTCAFVLSFAAAPTTLAQGFPGGDTAAPSSYGGPIPASVIGDDPDPVPLGIVEPEIPGDPYWSATEVSEKRILIARVAFALQLAACLPAGNGTPCAAGIEAAVRALGARRAPSVTEQRSLSRGAHLGR